MKNIPNGDLENTVKKRNFDENVLAMVAMNIEYFEKMTRKWFETKIIAEGLKDVNSGNTFDGDVAISNIKNKYGI